ncbi:MAG TPA: hypothetical protein VNX28_02505 [Gemmataceae bacterium]|jgi:hypothetical protein|nr:hypothetical protein [Gemmataceae bacterium]
MAGKITGCVLKIVAVLFTSLVAPVLVNMTVMDIKADLSAFQHKEQPCIGGGSAPADSSGRAMIPHAEAAQSPPNAEVKRTKPQTVEVTQIIVQGTGKTPKEAIQDALRNGLARAIAAQVGADAWVKYGQVLLGNVSRNSAGLIRSWTEIGTSKELRLKGTVHHKEVAMEVDHHALADRIRSTCSADPR